MFATVTYVDWFWHQRLHGEITTDTSPVKEDAGPDYCPQTKPAAEEAVTQ